MTPTTTPKSTIKSDELFNQLNQFRIDAGQGMIRYNDFMSRIADELDSSDYEIIVVQNSNKTETKLAYLDKDQCLLVGMRESKAVRKRVLEWIKTLEEASSVPALPDFTDPKVITGLLVTLQDTQQENKRLNRVCNDLASQLSSGITSCQFAKLLNGVNSQQIQGYLITKGHLKHYAGGDLRGIRVTSKGRNTEYYVQKWTNRKDFKVGSAVLTERGAKWLYSQYQKDYLPMLKNWSGSKSHDLFLSEQPALALAVVK